MAYRVVDKGVRHRTAAADPDEAVRLVLPAKDFLFAQTSIVCSVMLETNSYLIRPETAKFVNANGDTWSNESLKANYETLVGAFNFVNHVQVPEKSVGFIADAALRRIILDPAEQIWIYYVDILVATSRKFTDLCDLILTDKIKYLSMGANMDISMCSACGNMAQDEMELCDHMNSKGRYFIDRKGVRRITAEILGTPDPGTCVFIESSWLTEVPASSAAVRRSLLAIDPDQSVVINMPLWAVEREAVQMWATPYAG